MEIKSIQFEKKENCLHSQPVSICRTAQDNTSYKTQPKKKKSNRHIDQCNRIQNSNPQIYAEGISIGKGTFFNEQYLNN